MKHTELIEGSSKPTVAIQTKSSIYLKAKPRLGSVRESAETKTVTKVYNNKITECYKDSDFSYAKSKYVTTVWLDKCQFSYLNEPSDTEEFKFIKRNEANLFVCSDKIIEECPEIQGFLKEINDLTENGALFSVIPKDVERNKTKQILKRVLFGALGLSFLGSSLLLFRFDRVTEALILLVFGILVLLGTASAVFAMTSKKQMTYLEELRVGYLLAFKVDAVIKKWNKEHFLAKNIEVSSVWSLSYIQISFDPLLSLEIEDIPYPFGTSE